MAACLQSNDDIDQALRCLIGDVGSNTRQPWEIRSASQTFRTLSQAIVDGQVNYRIVECNERSDLYVDNCARFTIAARDRIFLALVLMYSVHAGRVPWCICLPREAPTQFEACRSAFPALFDRVPAGPPRKKPIVAP